MASITESKKRCSNEDPSQKKRRSEGCLREFSSHEHKQLVESSKIFHGSVVRIYTKTANHGLIGTGTGFLVFQNKKRSLFLTCEHNFEECEPTEKLEIGDKKKHMIRFLYGGGTKDLPVDKIITRDTERDLLLFSVKKFPSRICMELSTTETGRQWDKVLILGYVAPTLIIETQYVELVMVKKPSVFPGKIICDPYKDKNSANHKEKIWNTCKATKGVSGSPLLKSNKVVGVHLATDKDWREAISAGAVLEWFRAYLNLENGNNDTIDKLLEKIHNDYFKK